MNNYAVITNASNINKNKWYSFVCNHPHGNIFQTPEMYNVYQQTKKYQPRFVAVLDENEEMVGILLAVIQKEHSGLLGKFSSRSIVWGGPLVQKCDSGLLDCILREYNKSIKGAAIYTQFRNLWDWKDKKGLFESNGFNYEDHLDILFDLKKSENDLWKEMRGTRRKGIKRAYNKGVEIRGIDLTINQTLNEAYTLIHNVYRNIKLPLPAKCFFQNAVEIMNRNKYLYTIGAFLNAELIGVRFVLCYKNLIYDWYAASKVDYLSYRPNDVLPWEIMKWGRNNAYEVFDFGGAGKPGVPYGVRDYKLKFGGKLVNYGRFFKIHHPLIYNLSKIGFKIWKSAITPVGRVMMKPPRRGGRKPLGPVLRS